MNGEGRSLKCERRSLKCERSRRFGVSNFHLAAIEKDFEGVGG
jgi:hypothetical protein